MHQLARFFSWVFQPLLMPVYGTLIYFNLPFYAFSLLPAKVFWYVIICNLLFTVLLPVLMILLLQKYEMITSIHLHRREERAYPIIFTVVFHIANYYFLSKASLPGPYMFFLVAGVFSLLSTLVITYYWKISLHMTGIGGLCGAILSLAIIWPVELRFMLVVLFLVAGLTGSSRLLLRAHDSWQLAGGFFAGFLPQLLVVWLAN
jgi:hypothetical protein